MAARVTQSVIEVVTLNNASVRVTQSVIELAITLGISCGTPPAGQTGTPYTHTFPVGSGDPPYTFSIILGALPGGLTLNPSTGVVTGVPTTQGIYNFTVQVADTFTQTASVACSITITTVGTLTTGGNPFAAPGCRKRNNFDWCMFEEALRIRKITFPPGCAIPKEYLSCFPLPWDEDFGSNAIPPGAVPFKPASSIVTPSTAAGDTVIVQERVPYGYDGLMQGIYWAYLGDGLQEGSGDIVWRVKLNQRYLEDLGNVPFSLGSSISPMPLTEGQILLSGQLYQILVNVPNLSGSIQVGTSRIIAGALGFYWPR